MDFKEGMTCPVCEIANLSHVYKDLDFEYKGINTIVPHIGVFECGNCGESFLSKKDEKEVERFLTDSRREIDGLLTSSEIKEIRCQFKMTQVEFAKALRVGEKNFARYETGAATQSSSMDNLLRVLRRYPEAINEFYSEGWTKCTPVNVIEIEVLRKRKVKKPFAQEKVLCEVGT